MVEAPSILVTTTGGCQCLETIKSLFNQPSCLLLFPPLSQAVLRITERDGVTKDDALRRLQSQWSNAKQVEHANVVLSTLWEPEVTRKQVRHNGVNTSE